MRNKRFSLFKFIIIILVIFLIIGAISYFLHKDSPAVIDDDTSEVIDNQPKEDESGRNQYYNSNAASYTTNWNNGSNVGQIDNTVVNPKRTEIIGNNVDTFTIMVYMCGSDLESEAAMAVYDLVEMSKANLGNKIKLVVFAGGTTKWHAEGLSTRNNQILEIIDGRVTIIEENAGTGSMVDPNTLSSFIDWVEDRYEANRKVLIFWDHGGGSVSGYGYDERFPRQGSMGLAQIDQALTEADVKFDFIGFDTCLMANTENALMIAEHADYLVASEESEPGVGWYYTDWLTALGNNTSMPTVEIGRRIADSFVSQCAKDTPRQSATLSVIDLAELQAKIPSKLSAFAKATTDIIQAKGYREIANARSGAREFGTEARIDLVDLVDLANKVGTSEAKELADALLSCIKYNNTSRDMSNSYGLSIYFPYRSTKYVNSVLNTYKNIDMNSEYSDCVRNFASYVGSGQIASGGNNNAYSSFNSYNTNNYYSNQSSSDVLFSLLDLFVNGSYANQSNYSSYYTNGFDLLFGRSVNKDMVDYIVDNHIETDLTFKNGKIAISEKDWSLIDQLKLNVFIDDGSGYIDLGKDNIFDIDDKGNLLALKDKTWLAISKDKENYQVVPYYYQYELLDGDNQTSYGYIPVMINDKLARLLIEINDHIYLNGYTYDYDEDVDVVAKNLVELNEGDVIKFVCDYYDYDGNYSASHVLGEPLTYEKELYFGDVDISNYKSLATYELTDIYQQTYYTTPMN